ncbi:hypothetical protein PCANC_19202 [Puccinia coronata f. sp. avenae]|uniref:Uncharacterized protein n=1 Tax=Puccinia coronata f. sp. avenae TaxID=200324 RepID=A0A2N5SHX2_9BASI|nr:hypothetical protein PCANC_19202 [Puccinia coronata f. sp. avenae]
MVWSGQFQRNWPGLAHVSFSIREAYVSRAIGAMYTVAPIARLTQACRLCTPVWQGCTPYAHLLKACSLRGRACSLCTPFQSGVQRLHTVFFGRADRRAHALWACRYQGHKGLLKHILEPPVALAGAAHDAVAKKNAETVDILMKFMSKTAFESVITPNDKDNPHAIWNQIISC